MTKSTPAPITYGTHTINPADIHPDSLTALLRRGIAHFLGNEQASKVVAKEKAWAEENKSPDGSLPVASDEQKEAWKLEFQRAAIARIHDGTVGVSQRGPAADPFDVMLAKVAKEQIVVVLKANGLKTPKADEKVKFADGSEKSMDEMIAGRIANPKHAEAIAAEAKKRVRAAEQEAKRKAAKQAEAKIDGAASAEDLGL